MDEPLEAGWPTYRHLDTLEPALLERVDYEVVGLGRLRTAVGTGGFAEYFSRSAGDLADDVVVSVRNKHPELADLLQRAMATVGDRYPAEHHDRRAHLASLPEDAFRAIDGEYRLLDVSTDLDALMNDLAESRFWSTIEGRITTELRESGRSDLQGFWCDGCYASHYGLTDDPPHIAGSIFFGQSGQDIWPFELLAPQPLATQAVREQLWDSLLPPIDRTGWLAADTDARTLTIDLSRSEPLGDLIHTKTGRAFRKGFRARVDIDLMPSDEGGLDIAVDRGNRSLLYEFKGLAPDDDSITLGAIVEDVTASGSPGATMTAGLLFWVGLAKVYATPGAKFEVSYAGRVVGHGIVV